MPNLRGWEILILVLIVLLLFGSKKLPDAARGIGRSLRIFKAETKGLMDDEAKADGTAAADAPAIPAADQSQAQVSGQQSAPPPAVAPAPPATSNAAPAAPPAAAPEANPQTSSQPASGPGAAAAS